MKSPAAVELNNFLNSVVLPPVLKTANYYRRNVSRQSPQESTSHYLNY